MKIGTDDKIWAVVDPTPQSELADVLFQTSLRDLELQFKGGLSAEKNPTLFTDRAEAQAEAQARLVALRASQAIVRRAKGIQDARRIAVMDADGKVLFDADLS